MRRRPLYDGLEIFFSLAFVNVFVLLASHLAPLINMIALIREGNICQCTFGLYYLYV